MKGCSQVAAKRVDMLSALARLGGGWRVGSGVEELHFPARLKGRAELGTVLNGRQLRSRRKRGPASERPRRAKEQSGW